MLSPSFVSPMLPQMQFVYDRLVPSGVDPNRRTGGKACEPLAFSRLLMLLAVQVDPVLTTSVAPLPTVIREPLA